MEIPVDVVLVLLTADNAVVVVVVDVVLTRIYWETVSSEDLKLVKNGMLLKEYKR